MVIPKAHLCSRPVFLVVISKAYLGSRLEFCWLHCHYTLLLNGSADCREFQARVTRQYAAVSAKPEPQSDMFAAEVERERTTLGSLSGHGKNARVPVNRTASSASRRGYYTLSYS